MTPRTAPAAGERLLHRAGKKIDGKYALVTMLGAGNKVRIVVRHPTNACRTGHQPWPSVYDVVTCFVLHGVAWQVYLVESCSRFSLVCTLAESPGGESPSVRVCGGHACEKWDVTLWDFSTTLSRRRRRFSRGGFVFWQLAVVRSLLNGLHLDNHGGVTLSAEIPATWVAL